MKLFWPRFNQREGTPTSELHPNPVRRYAECDCFGCGKRDYSQDLTLHSEIQDTHCEAWKSLEAYVREVHARGGDELNPLRGIGPERWEQISTLPRSIGTLQSVKVVMLYGSHLVRLPPEIGEMRNLEELDVYTSYRLHWLPYEVTHCRKLTRTRASTRALYGNFKIPAPVSTLARQIR
jgi:hypothetical protein